MTSGVGIAATCRAEVRYQVVPTEQPTLAIRVLSPPVNAVKYLLFTGFRRIDGRKASASAGVTGYAVITGH